MYWDVMEVEKDAKFKVENCVITEVVCVTVKEGGDKEMKSNKEEAWLGVWAVGRKEKEAYTYSSYLWSYYLMP